MIEINDRQRKPNMQLELPKKTKAVEQYKYL